jgi:hypothetical protein
MWPEITNMSNYRTVCSGSEEDINSIITSISQKAQTELN